MTAQLAKSYAPAETEPEVRSRWDRADAFHAEPGPADNAYCILIPPPNVTAAAAPGARVQQHAPGRPDPLPPDAGLQYALDARHRPRRHRDADRRREAAAGRRASGAAPTSAATEFVVAGPGMEGRIRGDDHRAAQGDRLLVRLAARQRFTMDPMCARAVREAFFRLFRDGLIYRGKRLVNWDPVTLTALADDEVEMQDRQGHGHLWYLRYPISGRAETRVTKGEPRDESSSRWRRRGRKRCSATPPSP